MLTALYLIVIVTKIAKQTDTEPTEAMQVRIAIFCLAFVSLDAAELGTQISK
jgi:hypothetical protein